MEKSRSRYGKGAHDLEKKIKKNDKREYTRRGFFQTIVGLGFFETITVKCDTYEKDSTSQR